MYFNECLSLIFIDTSFIQINTIENEMRSNFVKLCKIFIEYNYTVVSGISLIRSERPNVYFFFSIKTINRATTPKILIRLMETALSALSSLLLSHLFTYIVSSSTFIYSTVFFLIYISRKIYIHTFPQNCYSVINYASFLRRIPLRAWKSSVLFPRIPPSTT